MAKRRELKPIMEAIGFGKPAYEGAPEPVSVAVTGTGPDGRLSGILDVFPRGYESFFGGCPGFKNISHHGSGRYSFMHGNGAVRNSDLILPTLCAEAQRVADKFLADYPNALLLHRVVIATKEAEAALNKVNDTNDRLIRARKEYDAALKKVAIAEAQFRKAGGK